jgi:hypothetical protein
MPAHKRVTDEAIREAVRLRMLLTMRTGTVPGWGPIAEHLGITERHLRNVRRTPAWEKALREAGSRDDEELLTQARARLALLVGSKDERIALAAARTIFEYTVGAKLEVLARTESSIRVTSFDVASLTNEQLRLVSREVALASGVGPGRALPAAALDPDVIDAEVVESD